jgi:NADH-quinone oxidoreductase subunit H
MPDFLQPIATWVSNNIHWIALTFAVHNIVLGTVGMLIWLERKVASWAQDRVGPNRADFSLGIITPLKGITLFGILQSMADGLKMFTKEDYRAKNTDRALFTLAPGIMMLVVVVSIAVIPWGGIVGSRQASIPLTPTVAEDGKTVLVQQSLLALVPDNKNIVGNIEIRKAGTDATQPADAYYDGQTGELVAGVALTPADLTSPVSASFTQGWHFQIANLNIGVLFIVATLSIAVYGIVIGGYASNNKYSFLGGLRATANMISYEIPLGLCILCIVVMFGTLDLGQIVAMQAHTWLGFIPAWNVFVHPITFVLFLVCLHAEANRAPFDTAECEQELVGGYHTEYSSMRFGLFFLAEYASMITTSAVCVALFFGGWHLPGMNTVVNWLTGGAATSDPTNPAVTGSLIEGILRAFVFFGKTLIVVFLFMWTRWSLPRFRFDQIMNLAWRMLIPVALGLLVSSAIGTFVVAKMGGTTLNGLGLKEAIFFLAINIAVSTIIVQIGHLIGTGGEDINRKIKIEGSRYESPELPVAAETR